MKYRSICRHRQASLIEKKIKNKMAIFIHSRDVDGISRSRDIPRYPRIKKSRDQKIPGCWSQKNPGIKNPGIMNVKKSRDFKISPGISRRDFFPSFYEILSEMLLNFLVLMENLALHTNEIFIFCHGNIIFSYFN